jgi:chemotaxis signal transduction protein
MVGHDPLVLLRTMERRFQARHPAGPASIVDANAWVGLALQIQGVTVLIARDEVRALLPVPRWTPVPHVVSWVLGVARLRGRPGPVIDLGGYLCGRATPEGRHARVVVIDVRGDDVGLLVGGATGPHTLAPDAVLVDVPASPPWLQPYLCGGGVIGGQTVGRFSIARLIGSQAFFCVAC